jgi:DNA-binding NtrC family response regulator
VIFPRVLDASPVVWKIRKSALLGRMGDVRLDDPAVSRKHAELKRAASGIRVADLESRHGTFVDGTAVGRDGVVAQYGSVVRVGDTLLLVVRNVDAYAVPFQRIAGGFLGTQRDMIAGPSLCHVWQRATQVADLAHPVLIQGETGCGKEAVARLIHVTRSKPGPFVALNVAAIPAELFESELFGHARGAFTGAVAPRAGAFREASGGVLFLDEIGHLRLDLQAKLLRVIDQMRVRSLGAKEDEPVDVRVVAAASHDLREACACGSFRTDLYYRLSGVVIDVPPLRERRDEVLAIASAAIAKEKRDFTLSIQAAEALVLASWPGNVRELSHALVHATVDAKATGSTEIQLEHLPALSSSDAESSEAVTPEVILAALRNTDGNSTNAAKKLGISRATLYNVLKRHGVDIAVERSKAGLRAVP